MDRRRMAICRKPADRGIDHQTDVACLQSTLQAGAANQNHPLARPAVVQPAQPGGKLGRFRIPPGPNPAGPRPNTEGKNVQAGMPAV